MIKTEVLRTARLAGLAALVGISATVGEAPAQGQETIEIPLRVHGGKMIVPVETDDGTKLEFIVSTNGSGALSEAVAATINDQSVLTMGGVPVVTEHSQTLSDADLTVEGEVFDGMIASNTLNQYDVLFDAPGSRLVLQPIRSSVEWEGMTMSEPVPLQIYHGTIISLDVQLNGQPYGAMLELGTGSIIVNDRVQTEAEVEGDRATTFSIGGTTFADLPVSVVNLPVFERFRPNGDGFVLIGAPIATDCAISISYVHQEMRTCVQ